MDIKKNEVRMQYMLPDTLREKLKNLPMVFFPIGPLEWHGVHLTVGTDPINAERTAISVAQKIGGVVCPTLYMGTERERPPKILESLGFDKNEYIVGMDFPDAKGLFSSFYFPEEIFALTVRAHIEQFILHDYHYIIIINGHGAVNHNAVLDRLAIEFSNENKSVTVVNRIAFALNDSESIPHAGAEESSLMSYFAPELVDLKKLPPANTPLKYTDYSIVDSGGFQGNPGKNNSLPIELHPGNGCSAESGKLLFEKTVNEICSEINTLINSD